MVYVKHCMGNTSLFQLIPAGSRRVRLARFSGPTRIRNRSFQMSPAAILTFVIKELTSIEALT